MNKDQLIERLRTLTANVNNIGSVLYFVLNENGNTVLRFADIETNAQQELKNRFLEYISDVFLEEDFHYQNISNVDDRRNAVYRYDISEMPQGLNILNEILSNAEREHFRFDQNSFENIQGFLITIGTDDNKIALYKKHHPVNLLRQDRFMLIRDNERFVKFENDAIAIDKSFDFMMVDDNLIILKLKTLEKHFGFEQVVRNKAQDTITMLASLQILENIDQLSEIVENMSNARKLMNIRNSPVLSIPSTQILQFIRTHPELMGKIKFNTDNSRVVLTTGVSKKLFLKLLNDDYLFSQLTELQYDSHAKDQLNGTQS